MSMKIKICGLRRKEDIDYVNLWRPDLIGFVFAGKKRKIDYDTAKILKSQLNTEIKAVGVFVNEEIAYIDRLVSDGIIDMVQLHGDEDATYIKALSQQLDEHGNIHIPIIKAVRVKSTEQVLEAQEMPVDYLLLDAFSEEEYGGSGKVFNHNLIPYLEKPYLLAGGIDSGNVIEIVEGLENRNMKLPFCIDVSSSVEVDGYKDEDKIISMISLVQSL